MRLKKSQGLFRNGYRRYVRRPRQLQYEQIQKSYLGKLGLVGLGIIAGYALFGDLSEERHCLADSPEPKAWRLSKQREEKLIWVAETFIQGQPAKAYYELYLLAHQKGCEPLKKLVEYIESENFEKAEEHAKKLFAEYPKLSPHYHCILSRIDRVLGNYLTSRTLYRNAQEGARKEKLLERFTFDYFSPPLFFTKYKMFLKQYCYGSFPPKMILDEKKAKKINPKNRVTIRVWLPRKSTETGHVSLETSLNYISFWPSEYKDIIEMLYKKTGKRFHTLYDDFKIKKRMPDYRATFYSLDADKINSLSSQYLNNPDSVEWSIFGSSIVAMGSNNCAGMAKELLMEAGLKDLFYEYQQYHFHAAAIFTCDYLDSRQKNFNPMNENFNLSTDNMTPPITDVEAIFLFIGSVLVATRDKLFLTPTDIMTIVQLAKDLEYRKVLMQVPQSVPIDLSYGKNQLFNPDLNFYSLGASNVENKVPAPEQRRSTQG